MRVLVVFDKFKDCMDSRRAQDIAFEVFRAARPSWQVQGLYLSDGGEGFAHTLTEAAAGELRSCDVQDPRGRLRSAEYGLVAARNLSPAVQQALALQGETTLGVVEMAQASGLQGLEPDARSVWETTTFGTGQLLAEAARQGAGVILLGIGGSATQDLGLGALQALGLGVIDDNKHQVSRACPSAWQHLSEMDVSALQRLPPLWIATDVENPLLGANGAAHTFAKQKGIADQDIPQLELLTAKVARLMCAAFGKSLDVAEHAGMGAAGGIGFGLAVAQDARLVSGAALVSQWLGLADAVAHADLIITGEGRFDMSSLQGKGPGAVIELAHRQRKPLWLFAGEITPEATRRLHESRSSVRLYPLAPKDWPLQQALVEGPALLKLALERALGETSALA